MSLLKILFYSSCKYFKIIANKELHSWVFQLFWSEFCRRRRKFTRSLIEFRSKNQLASPVRRCLLMCIGFSKQLNHSRPKFDLYCSAEILLRDSNFENYFFKSKISKSYPQLDPWLLKQVSWHFCCPVWCSLQHAWQSWRLWNTSKTRCKIWLFGCRRIFHSKDPQSNSQNPNFGSKSSCTFRAAKNSFGHKNGNTPDIFSHTHNKNPIWDF